MKKMKALIVLALTLGIGCKSSETTESMNKTHQEEITEIKVEALTRGYREEITITPEAYSFYSTNDKYTKDISPEEWKALVSKIDGVSLEEISSLKAPSEQRFYDGDLATDVTITTKNNSYKSAAFDKSQPPVELEALIKEIYKYKR